MERPEILETKGTYDRIAAGYSASVEETIAGWVGELEQELLEDFIGMLPGAIVLDLGCGNGKDAAYLRAKKINAVGADFSLGMLSTARARNADIPFVLTDMRRLGFKKGVFSGVWANGCVYHVPKADFAKVLSEVGRVLDCNGIFSFNFKIGKGEGLEEQPRSFGGGSRYYAYYGIGEMMVLLESAGLEFVTLMGYPDKIFGETIAQFFAKKT